MRRRTVCLLLGLSACTPTGNAIDEARISELSEQLAQANEGVARVEARLDSIDAKLGRIEEAQSAKPAGIPIVMAPEDPPPGAIDPAKLEAGIHCEAERCTIKRELFNELLANPEGLLRSLRIVPAVDDGAPVGYKLFAMRPDSIGVVLGFRNGDTVTTINGSALTSLDSALAAYESIEAAGEIEIAFERKDEAKKVVLAIE